MSSEGREVQELLAEVSAKLEFEKLITQLSSRFIRLAPDNVDEAISEALSLIGQHLDVDRTYLFRFSKDRTQYRITNLWEAEGVERDNLLRDAHIAGGVLLKEHFPWLAETLLEKRDVYISDLSELPLPEARNEYDYCRQRGIQSFLMLPIDIRDAPLGSLGVDSIRSQRTWDRDFVSRLRLMGEVFANTMARQQGEMELREAYAEIEKLKKDLEVENAYLQEEIKLSGHFGAFIGKSEALKYVLFRVEQVAPTTAPVVVLGETGTGKELVARAIHENSPSRKRPMVKVNCAALPGELMESELFGREPGAFTGSTSRQLGRFEIARGSTLFLDEIGEVPMALQAKLLRVLESGEFERLGSSVTLRSDARIIAATNRDLEREVREGRFREDLWYRLKVFTITVPPLRQRKEDIPLLVQDFVDEGSKRLAKKISGIPKNAMEALQDYPWPGNIRELRHVIENALITSRGNKLRFELPRVANEPASGDLKTLKEIERQHILQVLRAKDWRIAGEDSASSILGMHHNTLRSRMVKLGIKKPPHQ
jgi:transcriptional regulator with GAF, ATPase, and Fis domain